MATEFKQLKLAILKKGSEYLGGNTILSTMVFDLAKMTSWSPAYLDPWVDSALGTPSPANNAIQPIGVAPPTAYIGIDFQYRHTSTFTERYFASALSTDVIAAINNATDSYVAIAPVSPFTARD